MTTETYRAPQSVAGLQRLGMIAAVVGLALAGVGFAMAGLERFYQAYLLAFSFWHGVALGSMALLMVQHLSGGAWGVVIRRPLEAAASTMPAMAVLFLPIIPGMTAEVDILTGNKTVLSYLLKPILRAKSVALSER